MYTRGTSGGGLPGSRLAGVDLNLLVSLHALLHYRSVTLAGAHVGLSQPAMSSTLRRLRHHFDDVLLIRVGREYQLTELALELIEPVNGLLADIEHTFARRARFDPAASTHTFSIELSDYAMLLLLEPLVERLIVEAPGITLNLHPREPPSAERVKRGIIDVLLAPEQHLDGLYTQALFSDRWVCAVGADNPDVGDHLTPALFQRLLHLGVSFGVPPRSSDPELAYHDLGWHPRVPVTTESFALAPFTVGRTRLATLVPERLGQRFEMVANIRLLELPFEAPSLTESMFWGPAAQVDAAHTWLRQLLVGVAQSV